MKREGLLRHLRRHGCVLRREGKESRFAPYSMSYRRRQA
jgi:hypothetical protein